MAKKNNGNSEKKTILVIFIEGDTEVDFYNSFPLQTQKPPHTDFSA
ncbi:MAG: hypothetical protein LUG91_08120 [Ruminococcus sp.]|nr:hypothetical protein [Ruminococcus sp.]